PLSGAPGIEPRTGGANGDYQVVVTFARPVGLNGASVTLANGGTASISGAPSANGNQVTVNLTGVSNGQTLTINLLGVSDGIHSDDVPIRISVLAGDTNADGFVDAGDIGQTKSESGHAVTAANFREDLNIDGFLDSSDVGLVKSKSGTTLP